jgi:hypothetical protein
MRESAETMTALAKLRDINAGPYTVRYVEEALDVELERFRVLVRSYLAALDLQSKVNEIEEWYERESNGVEPAPAESPPAVA